MALLYFESAWHLCIMKVHGTIVFWKVHGTIVFWKVHGTVVFGKCMALVYFGSAWHLCMVEKCMALPYFCIVHGTNCSSARHNAIYGLITH